MPLRIHFVAWTVIILAMIWFWFDSVRVIEEEQERMQSNYGRMTKPQQEQTRVAINNVVARLQLYNDELSEAAQLYFTSTEMNDVLTAGIEHVMHMQRDLSDVPDAASIANLEIAGKRSMHDALKLASLTKSGAGLLEDNVLARPQGIPSGRLSHEIARDLSEEFKDTKRDFVWR